MKKIEDFLINESLYGKGLNITLKDMNELQDFLEGDYKINAYCTTCKYERIFGVEREQRHPSTLVFNSKDFQDTVVHDPMKDYQLLISEYSNVKKTFECAMNKNHKLFFSCLLTENKIIKYGQHPSLADLNEINTKKYRKVLKDKYEDFNRGIGLFSHGIGAGSLIYLRRIFEHLIEEAHNKASHEDLDWNEDEYPTRMDDKIHKLKKHLPDYLVENRKIYGILSKGVHELTEDECKEIFPVIKLGIEIILDEEIEKKEREDKKRKTAQHIEKLSFKFNK